MLISIKMVQLRAVLRMCVTQETNTQTIVSTLKINQLYVLNISL